MLLFFLFLLKFKHNNTLKNLENYFFLFFIFFFNLIDIYLIIILCIKLTRHLRRFRWLDAFRWDNIKKIWQSSVL